MKEDRWSYLDRARKSAKYTIPYLYPPEGTNGSTHLPDPHQSIGARGVNNLAGKILMTMAPPSRLFYRLLPTREAAESLDRAEEQQPGARSEVEEALSRVEQEMLRELGRMSARPHLYEAIRHLLVGGNALLMLKPDVKVFNLESYVVRRSYGGDVLELVTREQVQWGEMPEDWQKEAEAVPEPLTQSEDESTPHRSNVDVYTRWAKQPDDTWLTYQEAKGVVIPGSVAIHGRSVPLPFMALRWTKVDGEHYGRSFCDDYIGDLRTAEGLSRAITRAAAVGAKVIYFVKPGATVRPQELARVEDGGFVVGYRDDVEPMDHRTKAYDFQVAQTVLASTVNRLEFAFLLATAIQRDAERVTAAEFRQMSEELQQGLGGAFSVLADDMQQPLAVFLLHEVSTSTSGSASLPKQVETTLITGVDALGRSAELQDLAAGLSVLQQFIGPEITAQHLNITELIRRVMSANGTRTDNLMRDPAEVAAEQQQQQLQQLAEKAAGPAAGNLTRSAADAQGN